MSAMGINPVDLPFNPAYHNITMEISESEGSDCSEMSRHRCNINEERSHYPIDLPHRTAPPQIVCYPRRSSSLPVSNIVDPFAATRLHLRSFTDFRPPIAYRTGRDEKAGQISNVAAAPKASVTSPFASVKIS